MVAAEHRSRWVQPIVVDATGTHLDTLVAVAQASVGAYLATYQFAPRPWDAWFAETITKSVRRAKPSQMDALHSLVLAPAGADVTVGTSRAIAWSPVAYDELAKPLSRLQVSGTDLPRTPPTPSERPASVNLFILADMSTGKAAAQAAHALFGWFLTGGTGVNQVSVELATAAELEHLTTVLGAVVIRDAGFTEVEPDTLTAVAVGALRTEKVSVR